MCEKYKLQIVHFGFLYSIVKRCIVATDMKKIMHNMVCVTGVYSRKITDMFLVGQLFWFFESFNTGIFSYTINVINVKHSMMYYSLSFSCSYLLQ